jgi:hypothetical protein
LRGRSGFAPRGDALERFLSQYGFTRDEYSATTYWIEVFGRKLRLPNPRSRRVMVPLHDLHHIATGYSADLLGEAEIAAWELRVGCTTPMLWFINTSAAVIGLLLAPRRTLRAFRAGAGHITLYRLGLSHGEAVALTVGELRSRLRIPEGGMGVP